MPFPSTDLPPVDPTSAEVELAAQDKRIAIIEPTVSPDERASMEQARSENEIIRALNSQVALWKAKYKELRQENIELKKRITELGDAASLYRLLLHICMAESWHERKAPWLLDQGYGAKCRNGPNTNKRYI